MSHRGLEEVMAARTIRGTTVVVTGATSGIGRETALEFTRAGARVVAAGRRQERLDELVEEITRRGGKALGVPTDVAQQAQVERLIARAREEFGSIDTLVNNAGSGIAARFDETPVEAFQQLMDVNFWGAVYACKAALPIMRGQRNGGHIVNVSSIAGKRGMPMSTAYCSTKFALAGFSEALRTEVMADFIDVTTIFPGAVQTEFFEVAAAASDTGLEAPQVVPGLPARELARVIVQNARLPQPEIVMSVDAQAINFMNTVAPGMMDFVMGQAMPFVQGFQQEQARARRSGRRRSG
jgi:NADP-dependent 3-hydroxy acid dehydrogenase YdfG